MTSPFKMAMDRATDFHLPSSSLHHQCYCWFLDSRRVQPARQNASYYVLLRVCVELDNWLDAHRSIYSIQSNGHRYCSRGRGVTRHTADGGWVRHFVTFWSSRSSIAALLQSQYRLFLWPHGWATVKWLLPICDDWPDESIYWWRGLRWVPSRSTHRWLLPTASIWSGMVWCFPISLESGAAFWALYLWAELSPSNRRLAKFRDLCYSS